MAHKSYLLIGFITDRDHGNKFAGVHTPLRQDGYYGEPPYGLADHWRQNPMHPMETVAIVQVVDDNADWIKRVADKRLDVA